MKGNKTLWRQRLFMSRQTKQKVEVNSVTTKKFLSRQEVEEQYKRNVATKKSCCDIMKI